MSQVAAHPPWGNRANPLREFLRIVTKGHKRKVKMKSCDQLELQLKLVGLQRVPVMVHLVHRGQRGPAAKQRVPVGLGGPARTPVGPVQRQFRVVVQWVSEEGCSDPLKGREIQPQGKNRHMEPVGVHA